MEKTVKDIVQDSFWVMPATPKFVDNGIPYITSKNIKMGEIDFSKVQYISSKDYENISKNRPIMVNDMLISMIGTLGNIAIVKECDMPFYGQNMFLVRLNPYEVDLRYFYNYFNSDIINAYLQTKKNKSTQGCLKANHIEDLRIPIVSLEEQKRIASELDKITDLISKRKEQLSKLDELVKVRFVELFGDVGADEKSWGMNKLSYCCQINPKKAQDTRLISGLNVSFIPMPAVSEKGDIDTSEIKTYDEVKTGFTYFCDNDVLFAKITPCMENGKGAVAKGLFNGIGFGSTEFHVLRPYADICNAQWLYTLTSFEKFRKDAEANMTGSAGQKRVPAVFLENFKVSIPPIELQNQFAAFVEQTNKSKLEVQKSLEKLELLKKALMQKYFG